MTRGLNTRGEAPGKLLESQSLSSLETSKMLPPASKDLITVSTEGTIGLLQSWERLGTVLPLALMTQQGMEMLEDFLGRPRGNLVRKLAEISSPVLSTHATQLDTPPSEDSMMGRTRLISLFPPSCGRG